MAETITSFSNRCEQTAKQFPRWAQHLVVFDTLWDAELGADEQQTAFCEQRWDTGCRYGFSTIEDFIVEAIEAGVLIDDSSTASSDVSDCANGDIHFAQSVDQ